MEVGLAGQQANTRKGENKSKICNLNRRYWRYTWLMSSVTPISIDWLVIMVNAYSPQTVDAAGLDAVPTERADRDQPAIAARVASATKAHLVEGLWPVFAGSTTRGRVEALDTLLTTASLSPSIDAEGQMAWNTSLSTPAGHLRAACAVCLLEVVNAYGWARLGTCDGHDCADVYVDSARRAPRRYCSTTCLNRSKIRAFRSRKNQP